MKCIKKKCESYRKDDKFCNYYGKWAVEVKKCYKFATDYVRL